MKSFLQTLSCIFISSLSIGQVNIITNIPPVIAPNATLNVEVKITKGAIANFSKYQMDVPAGVNVTEGNSRTGNFTFEAGRAKIVWVSIPAEPEFIISFNVFTGNANGSAAINQRFFYLDNGAKQEVEIDPVTVSFDPTGATVTKKLPEPDGSVASNNTITANTSNTTVPSNTTAPTNTETIADTNTTSSTTSSTSASEPTVAVNTNTTSSTPTETTNMATVTKTTAPQTDNNTNTTTTNNTTNSSNTNAATGITYKVQVGAYGVNPGAAINKYKVLGKVTVSQEGGLYKAVVGNFNSKEEALKKREEIISKGFDGFVVAYKDGQRVK